MKIVNRKPPKYPADYLLKILERNPIKRHYLHTVRVYLKSHSILFYARNWKERDIILHAIIECYNFVSIHIE